MHTTEIQMPSSGRQRGRYSDEFKRQLVGARLEPGVSAAAVALANGRNANFLRRWVVESSTGGTAAQKKSVSRVMNARMAMPLIDVALMRSRKRTRPISRQCATA